MGRTGIEGLESMFEAAWRPDNVHGFRCNLASVADAEWDARPANHSSEVFGAEPELSVSDIALHVGGSCLMWSNLAFGDGKLQWSQIQAPSRDRRSMEAWLTEVQASFAAGLTAPDDDAKLAVMRAVPGSVRLPVSYIVVGQINHAVYHAGEVNRQRALLRGADGWLR